MSENRHRSGYPVAHDAPAFIAPPLDIRRAVEAARQGSVEEAVAFTLAFPIVERTRSGHEHTVDFEATSHHRVSFQDEGDPEPTSPEFAVPSEIGDEPDTAQDLPRIDIRMPPESEHAESERTLERDPYKYSGEETLHASERDTLAQQLLSIGPFDDLSDLDDTRSSPARVVLGRARAIRFRIALHDAWPEDFSAVVPPEDDLDLLLHPAIVVALADGAHTDPIGGDLVRALVKETRQRLPQTTRNSLREAGAAAFARITLLGTQRAVAYLHDRFHEFPAQARRHALALAARFANDPQSATAQQMVDDALG
ncbi:MAG: hypothetical protein ACXVEE_40635 [Polyangiales bacterium]